jgi:hypothetical protein
MNAYIQNFMIVSFDGIINATSRVLETQASNLLDLLIISYVMF